MEAEVSITDNGIVVVKLVPNDIRPVILTGLLVEYDGMPVMARPFFSHGRQLHTVCSENDDIIREIEY